MDHQLQNTHGDLEVQQLAQALNDIIKPLADSFKMAHAAFETNKGEYLTKMAFFGAFTPYGFGYHHLQEALDADDANRGFQPSAMREAVYRVEAMSVQLSKTNRSKKQTRLKAGITAQLQKIEQQQL